MTTLKTPDSYDDTKIQTTFSVQTRLEVVYSVVANEFHDGIGTVARLDIGLIMFGDSM